MPIFKLTDILLESRGVKRILLIYVHSTQARSIDNNSKFSSFANDLLCDHSQTKSQGLALRDPFLEDANISICDIFVII